MARLSLAVACVAVWAISAALTPDLIASPGETLERVGELIGSGDILAMVGTTAFESFVGLAIGAGLGVLLPFLVRMSPRALGVIEPFARTMVGVPKLALSPILILWFGIGLSGKIILVALMTFFLVFVATLAGFRSVGPNLQLAVSVFGASRFEIAREVMWNSVQPFVWTALRAALPWAINAALVGEFLAAQNGVGYYIHHSYDQADIPGVYAGIVIVVAVVLAADAVLMWTQRRCLAWRPIDKDLMLH
jgi:NitT/TauT family transport system permease protein